MKTFLSLNKLIKIKRVNCILKLDGINKQTPSLPILRGNSGLCAVNFMIPVGCL